MLMDISSMLKRLEKDMREDRLTPAAMVESNTFICFTERHVTGILYHQFAFEDLPEYLQDAFKGKRTGYALEPFKIVAIFDVWVDKPFADCVVVRQSFAGAA